MEHLKSLSKAELLKALEEQGIKDIKDINRISLKKAQEPDFKISFLNYLKDIASKKDSGQLAIIADIISIKSAPADLFNYPAFALNFIKFINENEYATLRASFKDSISQAEAWPALAALKPKKSAKNISAKNDKGHQEMNA